MRCHAPKIRVCRRKSRHRCGHKSPEFRHRFDVNGTALTGICEATMVDRLLRELTEKVGEIADRKDFSAEQVTKLETMLNTLANAVAKGRREQSQELTFSLERIGQVLETLKAERLRNVIRQPPRGGGFFPVGWRRNGGAPFPRRRSGASNGAKAGRASQAFRCKTAGWLCRGC